MKNLPKLILTDIDGVWTDGGMYYDNDGNELKKFNTSDSSGVLYMKLLGIPIGIITGENTEIVKKRSEKLKIDYLYLGVSNKLKVAEELIEILGISLKDVAYIGDDFNDIELLKSVGFSAAPKNASKLVKKVVDCNLKSCGGDGAFKDFILKILENSNITEKDMYNKYLITIK